ncbi:MAG: hypothetical protein U0U67_15085 [Chitinophagales bacterium]
MKPYKFIDRLYTDFSGYKQITQLYHHCIDLYNTTVPLDFYDCEWIDANLCALLEAVIYKLHREQNITFSTDFDFLEKRFDVFFRNGFVKDGTEHEDTQKSTLPTQSFETTDSSGYCKYVNEHLMCHRGMPKLTDDLLNRIKDDLLEIFSNTHLHAYYNYEDDKRYPFFVGGQYYPTLQQLKFTMVDLGGGFLPRIQIATANKIDNNLDAIKWAIAGNSTKFAIEKTTGGTGLSSILEYCKANNGIIDIITGNAYWSTEFEKTMLFKDGRTIENPFFGTTINLIFSKN